MSMWCQHAEGDGVCRNALPTAPSGDCAIEVRVTPKGFDSYRIWIDPDQPVGSPLRPRRLT